MVGGLGMAAAGAGDASRGGAAAAAWPSDKDEPAGTAGGQGGDAGDGGGGARDTGGALRRRAVFLRPAWRHPR